ncbi:MAG TPA: hypothetical protein VEA40_10675 [Ramlibacter sp.]|nr:hypothetical protein [Ramlibacter sp.]
MRTPTRSLLPCALLLALAGCGGGAPPAAGAHAASALAVDLDDRAAADARNDEGDLPGDESPRLPVMAAPLAAGVSIRSIASDTWTHWPESLAANVADADNLYTGSNQRLAWPGVNGATKYENYANCAGFVTRSLKQAFGLDNTDFTQWMGSTGPSSARYHDTIVAGNRFVRITRATDVARGDIVAIKYLDATSGGTGHTMVAQGTPMLRSVATKPVIPGTVQYELRVIDSTSSPHGATDTRRGTGPNGSDQDGAGFGTIRLYADTAGSIVGYTWSLSTASTYYTAATRSLVVGRLSGL